MLPAHKIRTSRNHVRYLFHNRVLRTAVGGLDRALELLQAASRSPLSAIPGTILVCNPVHIGDVIWASGALPVLRAAVRQARIGFLVHPASTVVVAGKPYSEWVYTLEHWKVNRATTSSMNQALHTAKTHCYYIDPAVKRSFFEARLPGQSSNIGWALDCQKRLWT